MIARRDNSATLGRTRFPISPQADESRLELLKAGGLGGGRCAGRMNAVWMIETTILSGDGVS